MTAQFFLCFKIDLLLTLMTIKFFYILYHIKYRNKIVSLQFKYKNETNEENSIFDICV